MVTSMMRCHIRVSLITFVITDQRCGGGFLLQGAQKDAPRKCFCRKRSDGLGGLGGGQVAKNFGGPIRTGRWVR
jgi:hypothetical protein